MKRTINTIKRALLYNSLVIEIRMFVDGLFYVNPKPSSNVEKFLVKLHLDAKKQYFQGMHIRENLLWLLAHHPRFYHLYDWDNDDVGAVLLIRRRFQNLWFYKIFEKHQRTDLHFEGSYVN